MCLLIITLQNFVFQSDENRDCKSDERRQVLILIEIDDLIDVLRRQVLRKAAKEPLLGVDTDLKLNLEQVATQLALALGQDCLRLVR